MLRLYCYVVFFTVCISSSVFADFSSQQRVHSLFNSELLREDEWLLDLLPSASAQYGVTKNLELGTSAFFLMGSIPNFFLKHRMFIIGKTETSFSSFTLVSPTKSHGTNYSSSGIFSLHGIVTSYNPTSSLYLNAGIMHFYGLLHNKERDRSLGHIHFRHEADMYVGVLGFEQYMSSKWALRAFVLLPLYAEANLTSDVGDANMSLSGNFTLWEKAYFANASLIRSWNIFNLEFGLLGIGEIAIPYINIFWRWH